MDFGQNLMLIRKQKKLSQADQGKIISTSGAVIGRYEREEITPSVEIANKIAKALGVSLDFLVGNIELELNDKLQNRIKEITKMIEKDKDCLYPSRCFYR